MLITLLVKIVQKLTGIGDTLQLILAEQKTQTALLQKIVQELEPPEAASLVLTLGKPISQ